MKKEFKPLPGSQNMRQHATRNLKCHEVMKNNWLVWGGENQHSVVYENGEYICDCYNSKINNICSHIIRVRMTQGNYPVRGRFPS